MDPRQNGNKVGNYLYLLFYLVSLQDNLLSTFDYLCGLLCPILEMIPKLSSMHKAVYVLYIYEIPPANSNR